MKTILRTQLALAVVVFLAGAACFAQSPGQTTYKAKCQMCHGATGTPSPGMAKMMGIKPVSDPAIKALAADQMFTGQERQGQDEAGHWAQRRRDQGTQWPSTVG